MTPWGLLELFDGVSADQACADLNLLLKENFEFYATLEIDINRDFHDASSPKYPLEILCELVYFGKSSYRTLKTLKHPEKDVPYGTFSLQSVLVSKATRKPTQLPEWWRLKYEPYCKNGKPLKMDQLTKGIHTEITSYPVTVYNSNCDYYKHAHFSSYIMFCYNAYIDGVYKGSYSHVTQRSLDNGIKTLTISFIKESLLGDKLIVNSWEDVRKPNSLNFEIKKENNICCQAAITFHDC